MPAYRSAWYCYRGFPSSMRGEGPRGVAAQVLKLVRDAEGMNDADIARHLVIPPEHAAKICQSLEEDGYLMKSAEPGGHVPREQDHMEVLRLAAKLRCFQAAEIAETLHLSAARAAAVCDKLGLQLVKAAKGDYVLREDLEKTLQTVKEAGTLTPEQLATRLDISANHAELLCQVLAERFALLGTPQRGYRVPHEDATRVLLLVRKLGTADRQTIAERLPLGSGYSKTLCDSMVKDGSLNVTPDGAYVVSVAG